MRRRIPPIAVALLLGGALRVHAQTGTTGTPPPTARAAGMALHDGTLPPGTLTARVVRGNFSGNLPGVRVTLQASGAPAKEATTGADGRAQFAHLTAGATVRVTAAVEGERLESEPIVLPADSGVRVLLVAGDQFVDTSRPGEAQLPPLGDTPPLPAGTPPSAGNRPGEPLSPPPLGATLGEPVRLFRVVMIALTTIAFLAVGYRQWRRRGRS